MTWQTIPTLRALGAALFLWSCGGDDSAPSETVAVETVETVDEVAVETVETVEPVETVDEVAVETRDDTDDELDGDVTPPPISPLFHAAHVRDVRVTVDATEWATIRKQRRSFLDMFAGDCLADPHVSPFTWARADVVIDGVAVADVGVRKKGWLGSVRDDVPSLKLKLDKHVEDQAIDGFEDVILNNSVQDPSYLRQCLGYALFAAAGIPSPRCGWAHVHVNGEDLGLYVMVESVDRAFLRDRLVDASGAMYEGVFSDFRDGWLGSFEPETPAATAEHPELDAVRAALARPDDEVVAALDAVIDLDGFFTYWAMEILVRHRDGYAHYANNFHVYVGDGGRLRFFPHGIDAILQPLDGAPSVDALYLTGGALSTRLIALPAMRARLDARLRALLDEVWNEEALLAEIDRLAPLLAPHATSPTATATDAVRAFITGRRAFVEAALATGDAPVATLQPSICWADLGTFEVTFEVAFGNLLGGPPGTATLSVQTEGAPVAFSSITARAGELGGAATLMVTAAAPDGTWRFDLSLDPTRVVPSTTALDGLGDSARLFRPVPGMGSAQFGWGGPGTLVIDAGAMTPGVVWRGRVSGRITESR